jgi:hypothetical protein
MRVIGNSVESYRRWDLALIGAGVPHASVSTPGTSRHEAVVFTFAAISLVPDSSSGAPTRSAPTSMRRTRSGSAWLRSRRSRT